MTAYTVIVEGPDSFRVQVPVAASSPADAKTHALLKVAQDTGRDVLSLRWVTCVAAPALTGDNFGDAA